MVNKCISVWQMILIISEFSKNIITRELFYYKHVERCFISVESPILNVCVYTHSVKVTNMGSRTPFCVCPSRYRPHIKHSVLPPIARQGTHYARPDR